MTKKPRREKDAADTVTLDLTEAQSEQLGPLIRRQIANRRALLLLSVAPFFEGGGVRYRAQVKFLPRRRARFVLEFAPEGDADAATGAET